MCESQSASANMSGRPKRERDTAPPGSKSDPNPLHRIPKFQLHALYQRTPISHRYGGGIMNGIVVPKNQPYIFLFSSTSPTEDNDNPYEDGRRGHEYHYSGEGLDGDQKLARGNKNLFEHRELKRHVFLFHRVKDGSFKGSGGQPYRYEGEYVVRQKYVIDSTGQDDKKRLAMRFILTPHDSISNPLWDEEYEWEPARVPVYATGGQALPTVLSGPDSKLKPLYAMDLSYTSPLLESDDTETSLIAPPLYLQRPSELAPLDGFRVPTSEVKDLQQMFSHLVFAPGPWNNQKAAPVDINTLLAKQFEPAPFPKPVQEVRMSSVAEMQAWLREEGVNVAPLTSKLKKYNVQNRVTRRLKSQLRQQRQIKSAGAPRKRRVEVEAEDVLGDAMQVDETGAIEIDDSIDGRSRRRRPVDHGDVMIPLDSDEESSGSKSSSNNDDARDASFKGAKRKKKTSGATAGPPRKRGRPKRKRDDEVDSFKPRTADVVVVESLDESGWVDDVPDDEPEERSEDSVKSAEESKSVSQHIASAAHVQVSPSVPSPLKLEPGSDSNAPRKKISESSTKSLQQSSLKALFAKVQAKVPSQDQMSE